MKTVQVVVCGCCRRRTCFSCVLLRPQGVYKRAVLMAVWMREISAANKVPAIQVTHRVIVIPWVVMTT